MITEYGCIFGMSRPTGPLKSSQVHLVHKTGVSIACMVGPGDKPFWFLFFQLPEEITGENLPRYSEEDELALALCEANTLVTPEVNFGQLYENVLFSTTTPLPHHVFEPWSPGRVMVVGDLVHKVRCCILPKSTGSKLIKNLVRCTVQPHFWTRGQHCT